jgi:hypothetical protein
LRDWQIGRLLSAENFPGANADQTVVVGFATSIAHQPTRDELTMPKMTNADLEAIVAYLRIRALA